MKNLFFMMIVVGTFQNTWAASTRMSGFVEKYNGEIYVSPNLYFSENSEEFRAEDYSGLQKLKVIGQDLYVELKGGAPVRIGEIGVDLAKLNEKDRTSFELVESIEAQTIYTKKKLPKVEYYLSCGITGCGIGKRVTKRSERIISLKTENQQQFCFYQNIDGRRNGVLYPEAAGVSCK